MGSVSYALLEAFDDKYLQMAEYLSSEGGYWLREDNWYTGAGGFREAGIKTVGKNRLLADFSGYQSGNLKEEMKYYLLLSMKEQRLSAHSITQNYTRAIGNIGAFLAGRKLESFEKLEEGPVPEGLNEAEQRAYQQLYRRVTGFITDYYDGRPEFERDVWQISRIPGARQSAAEKRLNHSISFREIPPYYREMVKDFFARLIIRRSWSYCNEMLGFIRYFFHVFYGNGYEAGFFEKLDRKDMEQFLTWVAADYAGKNATFRSKAVAYIRQFIDYIQLAEYGKAPEKDVNRLIFNDDIPRRERAGDTMSKVKYIPAPVREQLDAGVHELEPPEMRPVYILLRESGWRGTDVLNLRYDSCLDYLWNDGGKKYIPYLCGEITKTGIPMLKIPIRQEVADMVRKLADEAEGMSTDENNPEHYLFNTYEGRCKGLPYSKPAFSAAVQKLISRKRILDGDGNSYHFKAHSLRHTRAMEYTEQGMPIGIIQQVLGHCSLQMTLHYSKVSENMLYERWKETEKLELLHLDSRPPQAGTAKEEGLHYEFVRKNLDAVKVALGICFKPSKLPCRQQISPCMDCGNFCACSDNVPEYEAEIQRIQDQIDISRKLGRTDWEEKNQKYLDTLEKMLDRIQKEGIVHKNGHLREDCDDR